MNNTLAIIITGIYTAVYLVVFLIQRSEIEKIKKVNESMTAFMNFFSLSKLEEYNSIIEKTSDLKVDLIKKQHGDKMINLSKLIADNSFEEFKKNTDPKMNEMKSFIIADIMLMQNSIEDKKEFVQNHLPENSESFIYLLEYIENNKTS